MLANMTQEQTNKENRNYCKRTAEELEAIVEGRVKTEDGEPATLWDYFEDALDIEYRIGADMQYRSVCVCVAYGGPNVYIDTQEKAVQLFWGYDRADYPLSYTVVNEIDAYFEDLFEYHR